MRSAGALNDTGVNLGAGYQRSPLTMSTANMQHAAKLPGAARPKPVSPRAVPKPKGKPGWPSGFFIPLPEPGIDAGFPKEREARQATSIERIEQVTHFGIRRHEGPPQFRQTDRDRSTTSCSTAIGRATSI